jgi:MoaA/NifB/PqqE/SkfB family radical SAM enzyme
MLGTLAKGVTIISRDVIDLVRRENNFYAKRPASCLLILTYRCNSRCLTCNNWKRSETEEKKKEVDFGAWQFIIDKLSENGVHAAEVFGGNVLLRKNLLIGVLEHLKKKDMTVHLPTNQIGLDDEVADAMVRFVDYIYLSVDGVGEAQNVIRGQATAFSNVERAMEKFRRWRNGRAYPRLICNTTVSKYNYSQLPEIADYAEAIGFDEIHFGYVGEFTKEHIDRSVIDGLRPTPYFIRDGEPSFVTRGEASILKHNLRLLGRRSGNIGVQTLNMDMLSEEDLCNGTVPVNKCYMERSEVTVDPGGNISICPFINNYILGNMLQTTFGRIWNNERHRRFRYLQNNRQLEMCRHCIIGVQRNPSMPDSFKRIYLTRIKPKLAAFA